MGLSFSFEAVEVLVIKNGKLFVLIAQDLGQIIKAESLPWHQNDIPGKVRILKEFVHIINFTLLNTILFKDDSIRDSLHAIFDEVLVKISVLVHVEILGANFGYDILNIKDLVEFLRFFKLENGLL